MTARAFLRSGFAAFLLVSALFGCFTRKIVKGPGDPNWGVNVTWYGHSCFSLEDSAGRLFLVDPFDQTVGYDLAWVRPDAVLVTHSHFDHNHLRREVPYDLMDSTGVSTVAGIEVRGMLGYHDNRQGRIHGNTRFYSWEMGGLKFVHLGDVGQTALTDEQREEIGPVDVLFVPVGGKTTVDANGAFSLISDLKPRIVVPMHYGNERVRFFEFDTAEPFLKLFSDVRRLPNSSFQIRREELPSTTAVFVPALPPQKG